MMTVYLRDKEVKRSLGLNLRVGGASRSLTYRMVLVRVEVLAKKRANFTRALVVQCISKATLPSCT